MVGTTKKSTETKSFTWFLRNARHVCEGGLRWRTMYFATVACKCSIPSVSNSPWMRGAPHRGSARLIHRIRSRTSGATLWDSGPFDSNSPMSNRVGIRFDATR
jgi:hypothetical protein